VYAILYTRGKTKESEFGILYIHHNILLSLSDIYKRFLVKSKMAAKSFLFALLMVWCLSVSYADYDCVCTYNIETTVTQSPDVTSTAIGYLYEFDCKPLANVISTDGFITILFEHQVR